MMRAAVSRNAWTWAVPPAEGGQPSPRPLHGQPPSHSSPGVGALAGDAGIVAGAIAS